MATTSGYDYGIRQGLVNKGVSSSDIGYNPASGYVTVKGQNAIKAPKMYQGTSFTNQQAFNSDWDAYNKSQQQSNTGGIISGYGQKPKPQGTGYTSPSTGYTPPTTQQVQPNQQYQPVQQLPTQYNPYQQTTSQNPYTSQADAVINQLLNYGQNQANFDPYSSSGYRAAEAQANRAAQQNIRQAQEAYGSAGFGRSTALGERAQGIAGDATEYLMTQVVPQLEAQEQARRQQEYNNMLSALSPLMNQQGRADQLVQQDFNNNLAVTDRTGYYKPLGADQVISDLLNIKSQAEAQGITREARAGLSSEADVLRSQLLNMGIDPALFGSGVNASQAAHNVNTAGQRTLGGQAQDLQNRQANLGAAIDVAGLTGSVVTPQQDWTGLFRQAAEGGLGQTMEGQTTASNLATQQQQRDLATRQAALQEWQTTGYATPAVAKALGVPEGTPTSDEAYRQASITLDQDKFTYAQMADATAAQAKQAPTVTAATAGDMLSQALQKVVGIDPNTGKTKYGVLSDPQAREEAFVNMLNTTGLTGPDVVTALTKAGYSIKEINALQKEYPEYFQ